MHHGFKGAQVLGSEVMQNFVSTRQAQELLKYVIPCPNRMQILFLAEIQKYIICKFRWRKLINFMFFLTRRIVSPMISIEKKPNDWRENKELECNEVQKFIYIHVL